MVRVGKGSHADADTLRSTQASVVQWLDGFLSTGYGPHGGAKLIDGDPPLWVRSPALALREVPATPALQPFQDLAARLLTYGGDASTTAVLLAGRLVQVALASPAGVPAFVTGYRLARRQALSQLQALARPAETSQSLSSATSGGAAWAAAVLRGIDGEGMDLDAVEVLSEPCDEPTWLPGIPLVMQRPPPRDGQQRILLGSSWRMSPATAARWRSPTDGRIAETAARQHVLQHLKSLGVTLVALSGSMDEDLQGRLQDAGIALGTDVALSRLRRLAETTGATPVARLEHATRGDLGAGTVTKRPHRVGGWLVEGARPGRTLVMPGHSPITRAAAVEAGERLLRSAGLVLVDARALPGAGSWQREVAGNLHRAADAAPGRTPFALHAAGDVFASLAAQLKTNAAGQPEGTTQDAYACVRLAVAAAFDCAIGVLRVDARHDKRSSSPVALRGGLGRSGSRKGMPGDLPPLM